MKIIQKVLVKQIITKASKKKLYHDFNKEKEQLDIECQQLRFEQRKIEGKTEHRKRDMEIRFNSEIEKRKEKMSLIDFKIEQLDMLEVGSEIIEKEVEALVDVNVGSNWDDLFTKKAIVIQDNVVVRIDN